MVHFIVCNVGGVHNFNCYFLERSIQYYVPCLIYLYTCFINYDYSFGNVNVFLWALLTSSFYNYSLGHIF